MPLTYGIRRRQRGEGARSVNMEASRWWLHLAKAGDLEVVVACADIAERERDRIGSSTGGVSGRRGRRAIRRRPVVHRRVSRRGRGGGGIHRCGSLRADDCGLIDRGGRISAGTFYG